MFYDEILKIGNFILNSFLHIWPYLLVTIPLAVAIQMSGASKYIKRAFAAQPFSAIILATVVGAFSPFCSCGVIPVIASLLISGVPLAPVMSFWIASPSMDPEIFFLSVGMIGWELAVWRLAATLILSFGAGLLTHVIMQKGWLGSSILRTRKVDPVQSTFEILKKGWNQLKAGVRRLRPAAYPDASTGSNADPFRLLMPILQTSSVAKTPAGAPVCRTCSSAADLMPIGQIPQNVNQNTVASEGCSSRTDGSSCCDGPTSIKVRLVKESLSATWMVGKFMALAFLLEGLITLYVPASWISGSLGSQSPLAILAAALLGVPAYTTSLTALPLISGLLTQGMNPAAAIAFLVAGPTTTLPAMAAVWPLVSRRVFVLYVSFSLVGAVLAGYFYSLVATLR
ncbi:MAG: permease [Desulfobacterales bacterium]|nr:MAG: permease [Desulfobacterales bacterium]